jgi:gluconolactonase
MWQAASHYPDAAIQVLQPSFQKYCLTLTAVERLATGFQWCEGPVWFGDANYLLFSDIPSDRILRYNPASGVIDTYRSDARFANGNTRDREGRLVTCEHGARRVTRTEHDGSITTLVEEYKGKRLNSPNDVVVRSDGTVWFTDPPFGIESNYMGHIAEQELPASVYRFDPHSGQTALVEREVAGPNGLAFSPDEQTLYLVDSRSRPNRILAYDVVENGLTPVANRRVLIDAGEGTPDGLRCDEDGNLWCGWGMGATSLDGVLIFSPQGEAIGRIALPERCANLCFGGRSRNRLFMASSRSLYSVYVNTRGAVPC